MLAISNLTTAAGKYSTLVLQCTLLLLYIPTHSCTSMIYIQMYKRSFSDQQGTLYRNFILNLLSHSPHKGIRAVKSTQYSLQ